MKIGGFALRVTKVTFYDPNEVPSGFSFFESKLGYLPIRKFPLSSIASLGRLHGWDGGGVPLPHPTLTPRSLPRLLNSVSSKYKLTTLDLKIAL